MKKQFSLTDEEMAEMQEIAHSPVMSIDGIHPMFDHQEMANDFWKKLADKYGFFWDSCESAGTGDEKDFIATIKEVY